MSTALLVLAMLAALLTGGLLPAGAAAASTPTGPAPAAGSPATGSPRSTPVAPSERVKLLLGGVGGNPLFAPSGSTIVIYGRITPISPGSAGTIAFRLGSRQVGSKVLQVVPRTGGSGSFQVRFTTRSAGSFTAQVAVHVTAGVVASGQTPAVQLVSHRNLPRRQRGLGAGIAVRAQPAELRGPPQRGLRRRHRAGPDRVPEGHEHGTGG